MDAIFRRSSFFYAAALVPYLGLMGRFVLTESAEVFEVVPLFLPAWLLGALFAGESDERYAFLRTLAVPDARVARVKLRLVLWAAAAGWALPMMAASLRLGDGMASPATLVYVTLAAAVSLLIACGFQIGVWKFGFPAMSPAFGLSVAGGVLLTIGHLIGLSRVAGWPALSQLAPVRWLGGSPWVSSGAIAGLALLAFSRMVRVGVRVKASSEAHL